MTNTRLVAAVGAWLAVVSAGYLGDAEAVAAAAAAVAQQAGA